MQGVFVSHYNIYLVLCFVHVFDPHLDDGSDHSLDTAAVEVALDGLASIYSMQHIHAAFGSCA